MDKLKLQRRKNKNQVKQNAFEFMVYKQKIKEYIY